MKTHPPLEPDLPLLSQTCHHMTNQSCEDSLAMPKFPLAELFQPIKVAAVVDFPPSSSDLLLRQSEFVVLILLSLSPLQSERGHDFVSSTDGTASDRHGFFVDIQIVASDCDHRATFLSLHRHTGLLPTCFLRSGWPQHYALPLPPLGPEFRFDGTDS
uniref:Uncharacterized protein n=1 Tax=Trieres chinensis TaxID=1514140 RepID=A0A7S2A4Q2_TRICV